MNSHDYATAIRKIADGLLERPVFEMPNYYEPEFKRWLIHINYLSDKKRFLAAARALGSAKKGNDKTEYALMPEFAPMLQIAVNRSAVCRVVEPAKPAIYECEPLLSQEEEESISTGA